MVAFGGGEGIVLAKERVEPIKFNLIWTKWKQTQKL